MLLRSLLIAFFPFVADCLPYDCRDEEDGSCRWSKWTSKCLVPDKHIKTAWRSLLFNAMAEGDCKHPDLFLMGVIERTVPTYMEEAFTGPLLNRLDALNGEICGGCNLKARCCRVSHSFLDQSWQGAPCETDPKPCKFKPLSGREIRVHHEEVQRTFTTRYYKLSKNRCNFSQFIPYKKFQELSLAGPRGSLVGLGFCSLFGTMRPRIRCQFDRESRSCLCCCPRFRIRNGRCVPDRGYRDRKCDRAETERRSCRRFRFTDYAKSEMFSQRI